MLQFSAAQMQAVRANRLRIFEQEMIAHALAFAPQGCAELGESGTADLVRKALRVAEAHGFDLRGPARLVVELALLYGSDFLHQRRCAGLAALMRSERDQMHRAEEMYAWAMDESNAPRSEVLA